MCWKCCLQTCRHSFWSWCFNTLRPRQNGCHFAEDIFKCIFLNENVWIPIKISMKFVPKGPINNIPALVQIMAWRRSGDKPLFEPMMVSFTMHICITGPQWVKQLGQFSSNGILDPEYIFIESKYLFIMLAMYWILSQFMDANGLVLQLQCWQIPYHIMPPVFPFDNWRLTY